VGSLPGRERSRERTDRAVLPTVVNGSHLLWMSGGAVPFKSAR
jgi:hypothetical protein